MMKLKINVSSSELFFKGLYREHMIFKRQTVLDTISFEKNETTRTDSFLKIYLTKYIVLFLISTISLNSYCQEKTIHIPKNKKGDTSYFFEYHNKLLSKIDLSKISTTKHSFYFRLFTNNQVIEIYKNKENTYQGQVTNWVKRVSENKNLKEKFYFEHLKLDSNQVIRLRNLIDSTNINSIPSQEEIKNWGQGFDGITYAIEFSTNSEYYYKSYWTPTSQGDLKEAIIVQDFIEKALNIINYTKIYILFSKNIPFQCFGNDDMYVTCRGITKKEERLIKRKVKHE